MVAARKTRIAGDPLVGTAEAPDSLPTALGFGTLTAGALQGAVGYSFRRRLSSLRDAGHESPTWGTYRRRRHYRRMSLRRCGLE